MEKSRKLEILKLIKKDLNETNIHLNTRVSKGICVRLYLLFLSDIITSDEEIGFMCWFNKQKPRKRVNYLFTENKAFTGTIWWWTRDIEGFNQRVLFVNHLIKKLEK